MKEDGWFLFDSIRPDLWNNPKYENSGYLTMETFLGDSYLTNNNFSPKVINVLKRSINCGDCCEITVKIVDFNPYQRYQQANAFLFFSDNPVPSLRFGHSCGGNYSLVQAFFREQEYGNSNLTPSHLFQERINISPIKNWNVQNLRMPEVQIDSLTLKLRIEKNNYFFSFKIDKEPYIPINSVKVNYSPPKYLGIAAFQGRPDIPYPVYPVADTLPVHFEYVRLRKCNEID